jgi:hypothetical protein
MVTLTSTASLNKLSSVLNAVGDFSGVKCEEREEEEDKQEE